MGALIIQRPLSVIVEEGENVTLENGSLTILKVEKTDDGTYACTAKNLLGHDTAIAQVTVIDRLKFTLTPPIKAVTSVSWKLMLHCDAQGAIVVDWIRVGKHLSRNHILYPNGTLLLRNISPMQMMQDPIRAWQTTLCVQ